MIPERSTRATVMRSPTISRSESPGCPASARFATDETCSGGLGASAPASAAGGAIANNASNAGSRVMGLRRAALLLRVLAAVEGGLRLFDLVLGRLGVGLGLLLQRL